MSIDALFRQANALQTAGDFAGAERRYRALLHLRPLWAHHNLGVVSVKTGRFQQAEQEFRAALAIDPDAPGPRHSLGMLLLAGGRFDEGWREYEARRGVRGLTISEPHVACPEWRGEDLTGKHLLVVWEQGLGDQIQFARFLPILAGRGVKVTFVCQAPLIPLFEGMPVDLLPAGSDLPAADAWTLLCSIPLRLGVTLETIPAQSGLPLRSTTRGGGVGIVARGSHTHTNDRFRSLKGEAAKRLSALGRDLSPEATGARNFRDTAEIVAGLDLVISVDTAIAHLAASMGKPTWVLIPFVETDWRWLRERVDSPWYPSVKLYRQGAAGGWSAVLDRVTADLAAAPPSQA
jgi:hypothetical protein